MTDLDYYLTCDHSARRNTTLLSTVSGAAVGMFSEWLGVPFKTAAAFCILTVGAVEITRAWRYAKPADTRKKIGDLPSPTRRSLILAPLAAALLFIILSALPIPRIEAAVIERKLKENADSPFDPQNLREAEQSLARAQVAQIKLRPSVVKTAGEKILKAAENDPAAWNATLAFLDYRSFLNADSQPPLTDPDLDPSISAMYATLSVPAADHPPAFEVQAFGRAPSAQAARLNVIGVNQQEGRPFGHAFVLVEGKKNKSSVWLDNMDMKNVVVRNASVVYLGGPVMMADVCFVNCTLRINRTSAGVELARQFLENPCVTFAARMVK